MLFEYWEVTIVIEMVVGEKDDSEVHKVGKVVTREWRKAKSAKLEFAFVSAFRDNSSFVLNILGPLCLWQCFLGPRGPLRTPLVPVVVVVRNKNSRL